MVSRPLGAKIPPDQRLVLFEAYIRDVHAAIEALEDAVHELDTGLGPTCDEVSPRMAWADLHIALVRLQDLKGHSFRAPR